MIERIGIKGLLPFNIENQLQTLKGNLLFFDRICVGDLDDLLTFLMSRPHWIEDSEFLAGEIEWLRDQNLIFEIKDNDLPIPARDKAEDVIELLSLSNRIHQESLDILKELIEIVKKDPNAKNINELDRARERVQMISKGATEYRSRAIAIGLNNSPKIIATPIIETMAKLPKELKSKEVDIINIILDKIPCPIPSTPWEQILDFKNDPDSKAKLNGLRQWTNDISKENLSIKESSEKIQWLLSEYSKHMDLHKMKTQFGVVKLILVSGAELIENLVKLKLGEFTKKILSTDSIKVKLLEAELSAPNRELGYLYLLREKFGTKSN